MSGDVHLVDVILVLAGVAIGALGQRLVERRTSRKRRSAWSAERAVLRLVTDRTTRRARSP